MSSSLQTQKTIAIWLPAKRHPVQIVKDVNEAKNRKPAVFEFRDSDPDHMQLALLTGIIFDIPDGHGLFFGFQRGVPDLVKCATNDRRVRKIVFAEVSALKV